MVFFCLGKIFSVEEEKLLEIKYDRRTARPRKSGIEPNLQEIKSDGNFKFQLGRTNLVFAFKHIYDLRVGKRQKTIIIIYYLMLLPRVNEFIYFRGRGEGGRIGVSLGIKSLPLAQKIENPETEKRYAFWLYYCLRKKWDHILLKY